MNFRIKAIYSIIGNFQTTEKTSRLIALWEKQKSERLLGRKQVLGLPKGEL